MKTKQLKRLPVGIQTFSTIIEEEPDLYTLDLPNREVRIGLMRSLLPVYVPKVADRSMTLAAKMSTLLRRDDIDDRPAHSQGRHQLRHRPPHPQ